MRGYGAARDGLGAYLAQAIRAKELKLLDANERLVHGTNLTYTADGGHTKGILGSRKEFTGTTADPEAMEKRRNIGADACFMVKNILQL